MFNLFRRPPATRPAALKVQLNLESLDRRDVPSSGIDGDVPRCGNEPPPIPRGGCWPGPSPFEASVIRVIAANPAEPDPEPWADAGLVRGIAASPMGPDPTPWVAIPPPTPWAPPPDPWTPAAQKVATLNLLAHVPVPVGGVAAPQVR